MADKCLNLSDECDAELVHLCPQGERCNSSSRGHSKMYTHSTIGNSQRTPTKTNKTGGVAKAGILME